MESVDAEGEFIKLVPSNARPSSISELAQTISATEPRFTFYRFTHEHAGHKSSLILFFFTCPVRPGIQAVKSRMIYPLMKRAVLEVASQESGLSAEKKFELEESNDITEDLILEELYPKAEVEDGTRPV